jgi:hypothetical protein
MVGVAFIGRAEHVRQLGGENRLLQRMEVEGFVKRTYGGSGCGFNWFPPPGRSVRRVLVELSFLPFFKPFFAVFFFAFT